MRAYLKRVTAMVTAIAMLLSCMPTNALAAIIEASNSISIRSIVQPDAVKYDTYIFLDEDGDTVDTQVVASNGTITAPDTPPIDTTTTQTKFLGWENVSNSSDMFPTSGSKTVETATGDTYTYKAKFEHVVYVYFMSVPDENGNRYVVYTEETTDTTAISMHNDYRPANQEVNGWKYTDADGNTQTIGVNETHTFAKDTQLIPTTQGVSWVIFNPYGGTTTAQAQKLYENESLTIDTKTYTATRDGYTLIGWSKTPVDPQDYASATTVTSVSYTGSDIPLYAVWQPNQVSGWLCTGAKMRMMRATATMAPVFSPRM